MGHWKSLFAAYCNNCKTSGQYQYISTYIITMMQRILAFFVLIASASAFVPVSQTAFGVVKSSSALSMAMQAPEIKKNVLAVVAGAIPAIVTSSAALATDGTNEWFGVDDLRLLGVLFIGHWFILTLWFQQYGKYDEEEDFFGEIDYTSPKK